MADQTNYMRVSLSEKSNRIVSYKAIRLTWVQQFLRDVLSSKRGKNVTLYTAVESSNSNSPGNLRFQVGTTLLRVGAGSRTGTVKVRLPWGEIKEGDVLESKLRLKPRKEWSCEDVCEYIVKPSCVKRNTHFNTLLREEDKEVVCENDFEAGTFVSYARKTTFVDLVEALTRHFGSQRDNAFIWMDLFCANQLELTKPAVEGDVKELYEGLLTKGLHHAIARFPSRVIVFDAWSDPAVLKRAWCVWEVFGAARDETELEIAMTSDEYERFVEKLRTNNDVNETYRKVTHEQRCKRDIEGVNHD